jgi:hypothetical protein
MGKYNNSLTKAVCGVIAIVITAYLYIAKLPPFSLVGMQEEKTTVTELIPESGESSITAGEALMVYMPASLDQTIAADVSGSDMNPGANTWKKTIILINPSAEPVKVYLFVQGPKTCIDMNTEDCVQVQPQVTVGANDSMPLEVTFSDISPENSVPVDGKLIVAAAGLQREFPFLIRGAWQKDPLDYLGIADSSLTGGITLLLVVVVFYLLYNIFLTKVSPFFSEKYLTLKTDGNEIKSLETIFNSRLQEFREQGFVGSMVNPQPPFNPIDNLPTNLGRDGDILRAIIELLNWLLPQRGKTIRLEVVESQANGKGLSASIVSNKNNELLAERVFWPRQYGLDATIDDIENILITPLILWLSDWLKKQKKKEWEIKAYCTLANSLWSTNRALGKTLYLNVLRQDPLNNEAQLGLGRIWLEESNLLTSQPERNNLLKLAIAYLEEVTASRKLKPTDRTWLAAKYNLAVARYSKGDVDGSKNDCDLLSKLAVHQRKSADKGTDPEFGQSFETMFLIFKHGVMLADKPPHRQEELEDMVKQAITELADKTNSKFDQTWPLLVNLHYRSQYNFACYFNGCYDLAKKNMWKDSSKYAEWALNYLRLALAHGGGLLRFAREDQALASIRTDYKEEFDHIVGRKAAVTAEEQRVIQIQVEGPIVLKSESTLS